MKKFVRYLVLPLLCLLCAAVCFACGEDVIESSERVTVGKLILSPASDMKSYIVTGYTGTSTTLTIPATHDDFPIIRIGDDAFKGYEELEYLYIEDGALTKIGKNAFADCTKLSIVSIPSTVTSIGENAFRDCTSLTSVDITDVAAWCNIDFENFSANPLSHANTLSLNGKTLKKLVIPASVTTIESTTFYQCSFESIFVDSENTSYHSIGNCLIETATKKLIRGCNNSTIPTDGSVTTICEYAFSGCSSMQNITVPDSITSIELGAFSGCSSLKNITLPFVGNKVKSANSTYQYPFGYIFGKDAFLNGVPTAQYYYGESTSKTTGSSYYIPSTLKTVTITGGNILYGAFWDCENIQQITLPSELTKIENGAFRGCKALTDITIPETVTHIGEFAFRFCEKLTTVVIPDSVQSIGTAAFADCTGISNLTIGRGVKTLGTDAFYNCAALVKLNYNATLAYDLNSSNNGTFYQAGHGGNGITVVIGANVLALPAHLFHPAPSYVISTSPKIVNVVFAEGSACTKIGASAFYACTAITGVYVPDISTWCKIVFDGEHASPLRYGKNLYVGNVLARDITIPSDIMKINDFAFCNCTNITSITMSDSVASVGDYAFYGCTGLTSATIGNAVLSIGNSSFRNCTGLSSILIPSSVTSIGTYAFSGCNGLTSVTFEITDGWYRSSFDTTTGTLMTVNTPATNATNLKNTYVTYYWKRG